MTAAGWGGDPGITISVVIAEDGPLDIPAVGKFIFGLPGVFNIAGHAGVNYVLGEPGITIRRGRTDEFDHFQAGTCTFTLRNNNREFDPAFAGIALNAPGVTGASVTTPDHASFAITDLDVTIRVGLNDWTPAATGILIGQTGLIADIGWTVEVLPTGKLRLSWSPDGTLGALLTRDTTSPLGFGDGTAHTLRVTMDVNDGAGNRIVTFYADSQQLEQFTTAGTTSIFNSTQALTISHGNAPVNGRIHNAVLRGSIGGAVVADPDFTTQTPSATSFVDTAGRTWTVNGTAAIGYDPRSPFSPILKPRRQMFVVAGRAGAPAEAFVVLFAGVIEAWPQTWTETTGSVEIVAQDLLSVLAQSATHPSLGVVILDDPVYGQLDRWQLAGEFAQQFTGERIRSLIGLAGLSSQFLSLQRGVTEVLGLDPSGDVLTLCQETENAEAGFFFVDRQGIITFLDRHSRFQNTRLKSVQATFTDSQYSGLAVDFSIAQMFNDVRFTRTEVEALPPPVEQQCTDDSAIADFGRKQHSETIPVISDAEAFERAQFWCDRYGAPKERPTPVVVRMRRNVADLFFKLASRDLLDRIQLVRTPLGIPPSVTFTGLIEQLEHRITKTEWDVTLGISPIDVDDAQNYLVLDDATLGQLNQELIAY